MGAAWAETATGAAIPRRSRRFHSVVHCGMLRTDGWRPHGVSGKASNTCPGITSGPTIQPLIKAVTHPFRNSLLAPQDMNQIKPDEL